MLQLLPWAIGRRSGNDVVRITNAIVPGCLLPVCFPLCSYTLTMLHHDTPPARRYTAVRFRVSSICDSWSQIRSIIRKILKQSGMRTWERPRSKTRYSALRIRLSNVVPVSNSLCLSVYQIYLSFRLSQPLFLSIHTRQQIREESNVNFSHTYRHVHTRRHFYAYPREKSPFKVVLHPLDRPMPAVDPSG